MSQESSKPKILVLGSLAWEVAISPDGPGKFLSQGAWVGAPIIRKVIREALVELGSEPSDNSVDAKVTEAKKKIDLRLIPGDPDDECLKAEHPDKSLKAKHNEITTVFKRFPRKSSAQKPTALRVHKNYTSPSKDTDGLKTYIENNLNLSNNPGIMVVYDQDDRFHKVLGTTLDEEAEGERRPKPFLVIALADKIDEDSLVDISKKLSKPEKTVVLVTATGLRKRGLNIVEYGSIEQTVREVVEYLGHQPLKKILRRCYHLIILFEETGAIYIRRASNPLKGSIHFCPNFDRIAQMDREVYGRSPGRVAIALASVVRQLDAEPNQTKGTSLDLSPAVRLAVAAYNLHFGEGFKEENPFKAMEKALSYKQRRNLQLLLEDEKKREEEFFVSSLDFPVDNKRVEKWNRLTNIRGTRPKKLREIVKCGVEKPFRGQKNNRDSDSSEANDGPWFPKASIKCPYFEVGRIKTFDSDEIEGFTALAKLIRKYLRDDKWSTPLSIAVFGEPGSGKSFAVKELLESINPDTRDALTFNLAQFDSVATLTEAFHQVQDRALSSEDVPLVIFDEFDSNFDVPLGWLKYFLAPMQDGVFRGQSGEYRVGRAIFLFAGGTSPSFDDFKKQSNADTKDKDFKSAKRQDFVSRLHGFLDVADINPPKEKGTESTHQKFQRKVKRAVVLRSLLIRLAKPIISPGEDGDDDIANIEDAVIDAFLDVAEYKHGVRSMESVVRMSRWIDGQLMKASLPALPQLHMHAPDFWDSENTAT